MFVAVVDFSRNIFTPQLVQSTDQQHAEKGGRPPGWCVTLVRCKFEHPSSRPTEHKRNEETDARPRSALRWEAELVALDRKNPSSPKLLHVNTFQAPLSTMRIKACLEGDATPLPGATEPSRPSFSSCQATSLSPSYLLQHMPPTLYPSTRSPWITQFTQAADCTKAPRASQTPSCEQISSTQLSKGLPRRVIP